MGDAAKRQDRGDLRFARWDLAFGMPGFGVETYKSLQEQRMSGMPGTVRVYVETGAKRTFAGALEWPGWCRSGKDEASALRALLDYGPRYADVLRRAGVPFSPPGSLKQLKVVERLKGGSGTDYGAPEAHPAGDAWKMRCF